MMEEEIQVRLFSTVCTYIHLATLSVGKKKEKKVKQP